MVAMELAGSVGCCGDGVERKWIFVGSGLEQVVFDSAFCEVEVVNLGLLFRLGLALVSVLEGADNNVCVLAVELLDFCLERSRCCLELDLTRECRESFSIDKTLAGRE